MYSERRILFVCTGNLCRSPMAEYLFRHLMKDDGEWECSSAGTAAWAGQPASDQAIVALAEWDIDLTPHRSRCISPALIDSAEWILVMTEGHRRDIANYYPQSVDRIKDLGSFDSRVPGNEIGDPIGASLDVYRGVRDQIQRCLYDLVLFLKGK